MTSTCDNSDTLVHSASGFENMSGCFAGDAAV